MRRNEHSVKEGWLERDAGGEGGEGWKASICSGYFPNIYFFSFFTTLIVPFSNATT